MAIIFLQKVGCDGAIGSRAKADRCGVCNGDGSSCSGGGNQGSRPKPGKRPKPTKRPKPSGQLKKFTYSQVPPAGKVTSVLAKFLKLSVW